MSGVPPMSQYALSSETRNPSRSEHVKRRAEDAELIPRSPPSCKSNSRSLGWLERKDSNLQPSDPESAALPLRHSPSRFRSEAGRLILGTCRRPAAYSLVMTTSGFLPDPSERTVIRIDKD